MAKTKEGKVKSMVKGLTKQEKEFIKDLNNKIGTDDYTLTPLHKQETSQLVFVDMVVVEKISGVICVLKLVQTKTTQEWSILSVDVCVSSYSSFKFVMSKLKQIGLE